MVFICERCDRMAKHEAYRVTTEDAGVVLLNMVVCSSCARLAKELGLPAVKMVLEKRAERIKRRSVMPNLKERAIQP